MAETELILVPGAHVVAISAEEPQRDFESGTILLAGETIPVWIADGPVVVGFHGPGALADAYLSICPPAVVWTVHKARTPWHFFRFVIPLVAIVQLAGGMDLFVTQARLSFKDADLAYRQHVMGLSIESEDYRGDPTPHLHVPSSAPWSLSSMHDSYLCA